MKKGKEIIFENIDDNIATLIRINDFNSIYCYQNLSKNYLGLLIWQFQLN